MDFRATYYMGEGFLTGACRAKQSGDDVIGGNDIALVNGAWTPPTLLRFRQYEGRKWLDCLGTQRANVKLVSDRFVNEVCAANLSGWATYPVQLEAKDGTRVSGYQGLIVSGRCGVIDNARSVRIEKSIDGETSDRAVAWKGLYFADDSWDGSDFFRPPGTGYVFATSRVRELIARAGLTNWRLTALDDFERPMLP